MGQEKSLANLSELKANKENSGVTAILISDMMRGYCFIEGESQTKVEDLAADIRLSLIHI